MSGFKLMEIADRLAHEADAIRRQEGDRPMGLLDRLQKLNLNAVDFDDAVELATQADALRTGYKRHNLPVPETLDDGIRELDRFIADRARDRAEMELRELKQADAADMTTTERRAARAKRIAELEAATGKVPTTA